MRNIYLHVGWPKTGSTALQQYLVRQRDKLQAGGFYYAPNLMVKAESEGENEEYNPAHSAIMRELLPGRGRGRGVILPPGYSPFGATLDAFDASGCGTMILSNENLFWSSERYDEDLVPPKLFGYDVKVVAYFRRYDEYFVSLYKQRIKAAYSFRLSYPKFVRSRLPVVRIIAHLRQLQRVFKAQTIVRSYDEVRRHLLADFQDVVGIPEELRDADLETGRTNISFSDTLALFVLEMHRRQVPRDLEKVLRRHMRSDTFADEIAQNAASIPWLTIAPPGIQAMLVDRYNQELDELRAEGVADIANIERSSDAGATITEALSQEDWLSIANLFRPALRDRLLAAQRPTS